MQKNYSFFQNPLITNPTLKRSVLHIHKITIQQTALVSDDEEKAGWGDINRGVTLPSITDATNDIGLAPLFLTRSGNMNPDLAVISARNRGSYIYSNLSNYKTSSYRLDVSETSVYPSRHDGNRTDGRPLRCLVSTNNG